MNKDVLFIISKKLSLNDLISFTQINKKTYVRTEIWLHKLITEYPNWKDFKFEKTLKEAYVTLYQLEKLKEKLNLNYSLLKFHNLQSLYLEYNQIKEIPKEIGQLNNLQYLSLSYNQIEEIHEEIGQLHNLQFLNLSYNQIKKITKEIGQLHNLQKLWLNNNQIKEISKEIGQLHNLQIISLYYNQIEEIPKEIG